MKKANPWIEAMRLRTLPVSVAGVFAGCACSLLCGHFRWLPAIICLLFAVAAQIVSNFANEYYDFKNGLDKKGREGFRRGVTEGDINPLSMKRTMFALLAADCLLGCSLILFGGWILLPVGIAIALFALAYSTGPYPLSHHGLGDLAVIIFFGIVPVVFTNFVQQPSRPHWALTSIVGAAVGMLAANVLIVNNYRDCDDDKAVGKHTTVVIFGRKTMAAVYLIFAILGCVILANVLTMAISPLWGYAMAVPAVIYVMLWKKICSLRGAALNVMLKRTAVTMLGVCLYLLIAAVINNGALA
ncbi:MAG: 1,4-dihydroxy-2-naphthoate octaprenyltransferase [Muribaculum sp.]|nr:1,4-dihydroxy-2-naphthoate octaprenyltransferase [Muribaculum sp.]